MKAETAAKQFAIPFFLSGSSKNHQEPGAYWAPGNYCKTHLHNSKCPEIWNQEIFTQSHRHKQSNLKKKRKKEKNSGPKATTLLLLQDIINWAKEKFITLTKFHKSEGGRTDCKCLNKSKPKRKGGIWIMSTEHGMKCDVWCTGYADSAACSRCACWPFFISTLPLQPLVIPVQCQPFCLTLELSSASLGSACWMIHHLLQTHTHTHTETGMHFWCRHTWGTMS